MSPGLRLDEMSMASSFRIFPRGEVIVRDDPERMYGEGGVCPSQK